MTFRSADPLADFDRQDAEDYEYEQLCPVCDICGEHILDDTCLRIGSNYYHEKCVEVVAVDSYVEAKKYEYV